MPRSKTLSDPNLIRLKQTERIVEVLLKELDGRRLLESEVVPGSDAHDDLVMLVQRVLTPDFDDVDYIDSTNVLGIAYDPISEVLQVDFQSGGRYHYFGVEKDKYEALRQAASKGGFLAQEIKPHYPYCPAV